MLTNGITIEKGPTANGTRYVGGSGRGEADHPMLSGNFYIFFKFPSAIFPDGTTELQHYLMTAAEEYTPHADAQVKIQDVDGQGGVGASFISGKTISREFSLNYKDFWGAPVFRIHRKWSFINPYFGASDIAEKYSGDEYKGSCMIIQTKPIARGVGRGSDAWIESDITKVAYYDGVFPKVDLSSAYNATITDNTVVKPSVSYSFDGFPLDETNKAVIATALTALNGSDLFGNTKKVYNELATSSPVN